jgi:hypothetical protein
MYTYSEKETKLGKGLITQNIIFVSHRVIHTYSSIPHS